MIIGNGYQSSRIMLIADGASEEDVISNSAISGYQERRYKEYCSANQIPWSEIYKTCLIKDRINLMYPDKNKALVTPEYISIIINEINTISPNVIVPLSEISFNFCTNLSNIRKYRGSVLPLSTNGIDKMIRVIPALGLYPYINMDYAIHYLTKIDFSKVAKNMNQVGPIPQEGNIWIAKSYKQLEDFFNRSYSDNGLLVFDIETSYGVPTCLSFCFDGKESVTAPLIDWNIPQSERMLICNLVSKILASPIKKVNQNIKFDWKRLEKFLFCVNNVSGDTMLAAECIYPEFPKGLGFLTSIYTDMPYHKDEGKQFDVTSKNRDKFYLYCAKDSLATFQIYQKQLVEMEELGTASVYNTLMDILPLYKEAEQRGILIDTTIRNELKVKYTTLLNIQRLKLNSLCNREMNPFSHKQCHELVYEELKYGVVRGVKHGKSGNASTDEESLELLMWMSSCNFPQKGELILKTILACRKLKKVLEYIETLIHPDNRMRCEFNLAGTENLRTTASSYTEGILYIDEKGKVQYDDLGRSFQTIAKHGFELEGETLGKDLRRMFIPTPGYCFVEVDLSQAEARVDAILASDYDILSVFDSPLGIHRLTGSWVFNCPPEEILKGILAGGVDRYHESKMVRHAGERNIGPDRLMMMIHKPIKYCTAILDKFHSKQPNIKRIFHQEITEVLQHDRCLVTPHGHRRDFFSKFDKHMINEGISYLPQAIVSFYLKQGLKPTFSQCPWAFMLSEAHDGLLSEVPLDKKEEFAEIFQKNLKNPIDFRKCSLRRDYELIIPSEVEYSAINWGEMKPL